MSQRSDTLDDLPYSISVFFPCYNEQDNVTRTANQAVDVLSKLNIDYEIIIVNDGSSDNTAELADSLAAKNNRIKAVHHQTNMGYGTALRSGFAAAEKDLVFYTDGDGQFDLNEMPAFIPLMKEYDIVTGYRMNRRDNIIRKLNGFCWTKLGCLLFKMNLRDIDCAFKLYKREIFDNIKLHSTGALIDTEILARATKKGYRITERPVQHYPRTAGSQTGANIKVIFRAFKELFKLYHQIRKDNLKETDVY